MENQHQDGAAKATQAAPQAQTETASSAPHGGASDPGGEHEIRGTPITLARNVIYTDRQGEPRAAIVAGLGGNPTYGECTLCVLDPEHGINFVRNVSFAHTPIAGSWSWPSRV